MTADVALIEAVRTSIQQQVRSAIDLTGAAEADALLACPRCGDRIIALDVPYSFAHLGTERICRPCRAQIELTAESEAELGGEA